MREKYMTEEVVSEVKYEENKLLEFHRMNSKISSYRVYRDGIVGIYRHVGEISDEEGFLRAEKNLERERSYPFSPESGKRKRDMTRRELTDKELLDTAKECMQYLCEKYPCFIFSAGFTQRRRVDTWWNENDTDFENRDSAVNVNVEFKHVDSKDITDGDFGFGLRDFDKEVFFKMADDYLENYEKEAEFPEELIIDMQYYGLLDMFYGCLHGERLALGTSLFSGKEGEKLFSEDFNLLHDVSDEECWFHRFWDGDGCVQEGDKRVFIDKGVLISGYSDKRIAKKYSIPHTGNAHPYYSDVPEPGGLNLRIARSKKTVKELLGGRYCVIPMSFNGGGFVENGDYVMPVQCALLSDGEKILGKLPPFTMVSSLYDMFGKDFIGVGADNPIFHDKQILFKAKKREIL